MKPICNCDEIKRDKNKLEYANVIDYNKHLKDYCTDENNITHSVHCDIIKYKMFNGKSTYGIFIELQTSTGTIDTFNENIVNILNSKDVELDTERIKYLLSRIKDINLDISLLAHIIKDRVMIIE